VVFCPSPGVSFYFLSHLPLEESLSSPPPPPPPPCFSAQRGTTAWVIVYFSSFLFHILHFPRFFCPAFRPQFFGFFPPLLLSSAPRPSEWAGEVGLVALTSPPAGAWVAARLTPPTRLRCSLLPSSPPPPPRGPFQILSFSKNPPNLRVLKLIPTPLITLVFIPLPDPVRTLTGASSPTRLLPCYSVKNKPASSLRC